jgi:cytochrome c
MDVAVKREQTRILLYTDKPATQLEESLQQAAAKAGWTITRAADMTSFGEDSLQGISSIILPFSALHTLDHRAVTSLKRYLEAGGGGVVAVKDTLHTLTGWPWLQAWNESQVSKEGQQDLGKVAILPATFSGSDLETALAQTVGSNTLPDYTKATTLAVPDASRYTYTILSQGMDEPMEMAIMPNNNVLIVERKGAVKLYDDRQKQMKTLAQFDVFSGIEDGLLGVALDPDYATNHWVYFYYSVAGEKPINRLSRMELRGDSLIRSSEKTLLEVPMQRKYCCHSAGYLHFGPDGLLYLSTGDNTNAEETEGYIPIDERPGRELADDQATAASSNDLRGKILRIKPEPDGSYSIPEGNLFPKGTPKTRPEIYIMGSRNPYRFSVDRKNNFLYWGDIGPDTKVPASEGTLSYDEINQARKPGFYGWPYFLGENEAFPYYNYATKKEGPKFNPDQPINASPNNTGVRELPPAQKAMIWYGDGASRRFPLVGKGGQSLLAGPVYYSDLYSNAPFKLSPYYNGKLIIYDWVRRWFMAVTLDENYNYLRMEPFLDHITFVAPTDIQFAADGSTYILEYGTNWFAKNSDARLIRIEYAEGNRKPIADIGIDHLYGATPLQVKLSAANSKDFDKNDQLQYQWQIEGKKLEGKEVDYTFSKPGVYDVQLTVTDNHGESNTAAVQVKAGNAPPVVNIATTANRSFYWDNTQLDYAVEVTDPEDKTIDPGKVNVSLNFLPRGKDLAVVLTSGQAPQNLQYARGQYLVNTLDCKACHSLDKESVGPAYIAVARRYAGKAGVSDQLVNKIIKGGSGNWGLRPMSSHPDLPKDDAKEIVRYILSLTESSNSLPLQGTLTLNDHVGKGNEGSYLLMADYTDKGANGIEPLSARKYVALRNPLVQIEDFDEGNVRLGTMTTLFMTYATGIRHGSYVKFNQLDLTHISGLKYRLQGHGAGGNIEVHLDKPDGPLISTVAIASGKVDDPKTGWKEVTAPVKEKVIGIHDVYFVFTNSGEQKQSLFNLDWIYFANKPAASSALSN